MGALPRERVEAFHRDGYLLVRDLFGGEEMEKLRESVIAVSACRGDTLSQPQLGNFILDGRILDVVRSILGDRVVYFGESSLYGAVPKPIGRFHRDSKFDRADPAKTPYPLVRIAIYFQNHDRFSGGTKFRRGSHKRLLLAKYSFKEILAELYRRRLGLGAVLRGLFPGRKVNLNARVGDLALWSPRTHHCNQFVRLKWLPGLVLHPMIEKLLPAFLCIPEEKPRYVLFSTFGAPSEQLDRYIENRVSIATMQEHWPACTFHRSEIRELCAEKGVDLRFDGIEEARRRQPAEASSGHRESFVLDGFPRNTDKVEALEGLAKDGKIPGTISDRDVEAE